MSFFIGNVEIKGKVITAPMAGISNTTFRKICKKFGAALVVAEMVSDKAICFGNEKTFNLLKMSDEERPISQQIFGSDVRSFVEAAKIVESKMHPDIIDINMGCPVPKVAIKNQAGSALLKDINKIREIVKNVVQSVNVPVTVKIRSGWDSNNVNAVEVAKACEEAGASAIAIHGRTRSQGYSGAVDLDIIKKVVEAVNIPVIGNGDIKSPEDAKNMIDFTGCTAVMIGRGILGNPWLIKEVNEYLEHGILIPKPTNKEKLTMMRYHLEELVKEKNENQAVLEMRGQIMYYLKGMHHNKEIKNKICCAKTEAEMLNILNEYENTI